MDALDDEFAEQLPMIAAGFDMAAAKRQEQKTPPGGDGKPLYGHSRGMAG